ncbi:MAG: peptidoglycan bridge formation glycyltransferase FemA/FemB family protein [Deltaproteobacteria bacterium]|nr:peptidoglycan bridge formation glycyltransferase FemA/FemB family protein [Deltaproteobacteria bacterium]
MDSTAMSNTDSVNTLYFRPNAEQTLKEIKNSEAWDKFVLSHEQSGYCHLFNWTRVIRDAYGHRPVYLAAIKKNPRGARDTIAGILPLFRFKRFTGRPWLVSIPFFDTAGILARDMKIKNFLFKKTGLLCYKKKYSGLELRQESALNIQDMKIAEAMPQVYTSKTGLLIELPENQGKMLQKFKSKLRSQIKKGRKNGLSWEIGKRELLEPFYRVFSRNMRDLGSPVHSIKFFHAVFNHFYHDSFICVIYYRSKPVAGSFMFRFKKRLANPWASSVREFRHLNANVYLYWQMMRFACNMGIKVFDMGRSSFGAPTYKFKKQWGPVENPIFWYGWNFKGNGKGLFNENLSMESWKRLPVGMANFVGPFLRKHISL